MGKSTLFIILLLNFCQLFSQVSGDAGFSSIPINKNDKEAFLNYKISTDFALAENSVILNKYRVSLLYSPLDKMTFFVTLPMVIVSGDLGRQTGVGDINFGIQYSLNLENKHTIKYLMALKSSVDRTTRYKIFPSGIAEALPMVYNPSQGNDNLIIILNYLFDNWDIAGGILIPFSQPNDNKFVSNKDLKVNISPYIFDSYNTSAGLIRGEDLMLKVQRELYQSGKFTFNACINPIYRLSKSKVNFKENGIEKTFEVEGSNGLTLNLAANVDYKIDELTSANLSISAPVLSPSKQNDGLYRAFYVNLSLTGNFFK